MLRSEQLRKSYKEQEVLKGINLEVKPGEVYCLLGANGAGKSTTINIFLNFKKPSSGKVYVNDLDVSLYAKEARKQIAYIPEIVMLYPSLSGLENLNFFSELAGYNYNKTELEQFLIGAGLQESAVHKRLESYSKGMRQKVGIAIAVAKNAGALIMDEPTSGLDPKATNEFTEMVRNFSEQGRAVLMATHDLFNAVNVGTHIGIMRGGELVHSLKTTDINAIDLQKLYLETI